MSQQGMIVDVELEAPAPPTYCTICAAKLQTRLEIRRLACWVCFHLAAAVLTDPDLWNNPQVQQK